MEEVNLKYGPKPICTREGLEYLAKLPIWADENTKISFYDRHDTMEVEIIIAHPEHPPHRLNRSTKSWEEIKT